MIISKCPRCEKGRQKMKLYEKTIHELASGLRSKEYSASEVFESVWNRLGETEPQVSAYLTLAENQAREAAACFDRNLSQGVEMPILAGIPGAIKDVISTEGIRTTCGSRILENYVPVFDATVMTKLKEAEASFLGKLNMDEFAMGSSTENSAFQFTANPWNLERVSGGSSGGSAASVAIGSAVWTLGTDTGGSIRQPAAYCGIVGLKPTYGRVSRYGLVAYASSLDQIGPMTKDVRDAAILMNVISGYDSKDSTSAQVETEDFTAKLGQSVKGIRVGLPKEFFTDGLDPEIKEAVEKAAKELESQGAILQEVDLPHMEYAIAAYYLIAPAEASSNLGKFDGVRYGLRNDGSDVAEMTTNSRSAGFGSEVKHRILLGTYALRSGYYDAYYLKALQVRRLIQDDFNKAFEKVDVLLTPTTPNVAFKKGEKISDPLSMYLEDVCTVPVNLAGLPGISLPCGFVNGMPAGLQLIGKPMDEALLLQVAYAYEQSQEFYKMRPEWKGGRA